MNRPCVDIIGTRRYFRVALAFAATISAVAAVGSEQTPIDAATESQQTTEKPAERKPAERKPAETPGGLIINMRQDLADTPIDLTDRPPEAALIVEYLDAIAKTEQEGGAYAPSLTEHLLGLGTTLQQFGRHEEAIDVLKRGVHLARINAGLYSSEQIALLRSEIRSLMAMGDYELVDERQRYLYRVERQALHNSEASAEALLRQADWQRQAYIAGVGDPEAASGRLLLMWDLYRMSLDETMAVYGKDSEELRAPLEGMLKAQYLIAGHQGYNNLNATNSNQLRVVAYNSDTYKRGESVLKALLDLNIANNAYVSQHVLDLVAMGDWAWWFGNRSEGAKFYNEALALIPETADPEALYKALFGQPTPLPALQGIESVPDPHWNDQGALVVQFNVSENGRVGDVERLAEPDIDGFAMINRLLRALRDTRFRPRFDDGMPVETEGLVWSWDVSDVKGDVLAYTE